MRAATVDLNGITEFIEEIKNGTLILNGGPRIELSRREPAEVTEGALDWAFPKLVKLPRARFYTLAKPSYAVDSEMKGILLRILTGPKTNPAIRRSFPKGATGGYRLIEGSERIILDSRILQNYTDTLTVIYNGSTFEFWDIYAPEIKVKYKIENGNIIAS